MYKPGAVVSRYIAGKSQDYHRVRLSTGEVKLEHRHIMEIGLGRPLLSTEVVHHKNGNPLDNRLDNLEVLSFSYHGKLHAVRGEKIELQCERCGIKFFRSLRYYRGKVKEGVENFFCGNRCSASYNSKGRRTSSQPCGTRARYIRGCRCPLCRRANTEYMRDYNKRKG